MKKLIRTTHGRKVLFDALLSEELAACTFKIDAFFISAPQSQIMQVHRSADGTLHLGINLSFKAEPVFRGCANHMELTLFYRVGFIATYVRCLESACTATPTSYFSGLVILESVLDLTLAKKVTCATPQLETRPCRLRPIDVFCAIRAMTRIKLEQAAQLPDHAKDACERFTDRLITYTCMPEIAYSGSRQAQYVALREWANLTALLSSQPKSVTDFALFSHFPVANWTTLSVDDLLCACEDTDVFWFSLLMRLLALSNDRKLAKTLLSHPGFIRSYQDFCSNSVAYHSESLWSCPLLTENRHAMLNLSNRLDSLIPKSIPVKSGMMHFIR